MYVDILYIPRAPGMLVIEGSIVQGCPQKLLDIRDALGNYWPFTSEMNYPYMRKSIIYIQYLHDSIWLIHGHIWTHWVHCFIDIYIYICTYNEKSWSINSFHHQSCPSPRATTRHIWPIADYVVALSLACANSIGTDELEFWKDYISNFIGAPLFGTHRSQIWNLLKESIIQYIMNVFFSGYAFAQNSIKTQLDGFLAGKFILCWIYPRMSPQTGISALSKIA